MMLDRLLQHGIGVTSTNIKSIQSGEILTSLDLTDVTIANVNVDKSIVLLSYPLLSTNKGDRWHIIGKLTTNTNLQLKRTNGFTDTTIFWQVIEFENIRGVQKGDVRLSSGLYVNVDISEVDLSNSLLFYSYTSTYTSYASDDVNVLAGRFNDKSSLTFKRNRSYDNPILDIHWQVVEF